MPTVTVVSAGESASTDYGTAALTDAVLYGSGFGGYSVDAKTETKQQAYGRITAQYGTLKIARLFSSSVLSYVDPSTRLFFESGNTATDTNRKALQARPGLQYESLAHEPENKGFTPTSWAALQNTEAQYLLDGGYDNLAVVPLLMGGTGLGRSGSQWTAAQWFAGINFTRIRFIGADLYQWGKSDTSCDTAADVFGPWIDLTRSIGGGVKLCVGEVGARRLNPPYSPGLSDAARAKYLTDVIALCDANADVVEFLTYFESDNGSVDMKPWNLFGPPPGAGTDYSPAALAVWADACRR